LLFASGSGNQEFATFTNVSGTTITLGTRGYWSSTAHTQGSGTLVELVAGYWGGSSTTIPQMITFWNGGTFFPNNITDFANQNTVGAGIIQADGIQVIPGNSIVFGYQGNYTAGLINNSTVGMEVLNSSNNAAALSGINSLASNFTTTSASFVTTGLALPTVPGSAGKMHGYCIVGWQEASSSNTVQWGISTSATLTGLSVFGVDSPGTTSLPFYATGITTATTTAVSGTDAAAASATSYIEKLDFTLSANTNNQTLTLYALTSGGTLTVLKDSVCGWDNF
jgi:hypothetical protein